MARDAEITSYLERALTSELQGNVIDLCPVGALVSKPYAFTARPWELTKTESIDVMDAVGSNIRVDSRGREVMRILPRVNEAINEEWISDKTRFVWDGLKSQRLDRPYVRHNGKLRPTDWADALGVVARALRRAGGTRIGAIAGDLAGVEEMFALKRLLSDLGSSNLDARPPGSTLHPKNGRASYIFNPTIAGIEQADAILIVGSNPRREAAVLNARIRKVWRATGLPIGVIGEAADLTLPRHSPRHRARRARRPGERERRLRRHPAQGQAPDDHRWRGRPDRRRCRRDVQPCRIGCRGVRGADR